MEDSDVGESGTRENDTEESDHFEDCNYMFEITPILSVKVSNFDYKHLANVFPTRIQDFFFWWGNFVIERE